MTFTVTYRGKDGALREELIEAAGRADCMSALKARGIVPVSVKEGARKSRGELRPSRSSGGNPQSSILNLKSSIFLAAAVLVVAGGAWWWFGGGASGTPRPTKPKAVKVATDVKDIKVVKGHNAPKDISPTPAAKNPSEKPKEKWPKIEKLPNGREVHTLEDGTKMLVLNPIDPEAEAERLRNLPPPMFKHEVESALDMYVEPGIEMPPLPRDFTDEEVLQALVEPIVIDPEKDDEDAQLHKKAVQQFKDELKEYIKNGGTFAQYMRMLGDRQSKEAHLIQESRKMVMNTINEGKPEEAQELLDRLNKHLAEQGLPAVKMPPPYRKALEGAKKK